jgi:hypothetical protein
MHAYCFELGIVQLSFGVFGTLYSILMLSGERAKQQAVRPVLFAVFGGAIPIR